MEKLDFVNQEMDLARNIFYAYINASSYIEYNEFIKNCSETMRKDTTYLKGLRAEYYEKYATPAERQLHDSVRTNLYNEMHRQVSDNNSYIDSLLNSDDDESYIGLEILSLKGSVSVLLKSYVKRNPDKKDAVSIMFEKYQEYSKSKKEIRKNNLEIQKLKEAQTCFDKLIKLGFYTKKDCRKYLEQKLLESCSNTSPGASKKKAESIFSGHERILRKYELIEIFEQALEENREKRFKSLYDTIIEVINCIKLYNAKEIDYDIIDYFMMLKMPIGDFRILYKGYLSDADCAILNVFFNKYESPYNFSDEYIINTECSFATDEDKEFVIRFFKENNIPFMYFITGLRKYVNGGLDKYIHTKVESL